MADDQKPGDAGKPSGDDEGKKYNEGMAAAIAAMQQMNTNMETLIQSQQAQNEKIEGMMSTLAGSRGSNSNSDDDDGDEGNVELEHLSNRELVQFMMGQVNKQFKEVMKPFQEMIEKTGTTANNTAAAMEVKETAAKYKDFWYFKEPMQKLAKENPNLSIERMYHIAKSENPEIAKKAMEKIEEEEKAAKGDQEEEKGIATFGGFTPTSGKSQVLDAGKEGKLDANKSAESAWDKIVPKGSPLATLDEGAPVPE